MAKIFWAKFIQEFSRMMFGKGGKANIFPKNQGKGFIRTPQGGSWLGKKAFLLPAILLMLASNYYHSSMDVSVIIVTLNSADYISKCVQSVEMQSGVSCEAIVVDNGSKDGTLDKLKNLKCRVIASEKNLGFGPGNNRGFSASTGRYVFLLNPDAWFVEKNALAEACRRVDANPRWGMTGTKVVSV